MRLSFIYPAMIVLTFVGLAPASAGAQNENRELHYHYSTCYCHFGYPGAPRPCRRI
jgi:hypothetical protein